MSEYRVQFEVFEGPLDLLLHLVKKQEVDIYQVNLTRIATEFVAYIDQMRELDLEVAGEFLVMAASLLYIKSRELLPVELQVKPENDDEEGDDPRWELIRRLVEYKKFKDAAAQLQSCEEDTENRYFRRPGRIDFAEEAAPKRSEVSMFDLVGAVSQILKRFQARDDIREITADPFTVSEKIESLRSLVSGGRVLKFSELFAAATTRSEVVVTFLAMLELTRLKFLVLVQPEDFGEIEVSAAPQPAAVPAEPASASAVAESETDRSTAAADTIDGAVAAVPDPTAPLPQPAPDAALEAAPEVAPDTDAPSASV
jgi:segregation and condensation protein A